MLPNNCILHLGFQKLINFHYNFDGNLTGKSDSCSPETAQLMKGIGLENPNFIFLSFIYIYYMKGLNIKYFVNLTP